MRIDIVHTSASELIELLGPTAAAVTWLHNTESQTRVCAAVMRRDDVSTLVDAMCGDTLVPRDDIFPYHSWHGEQTSINFWQAAFSWTLYWKTILMGNHGHPCWMDHIMTPMPTPPMLGFLDISCGRFTWGFQIELAYRLADGNITRAVAFRKAWNARDANAIEAAEGLHLPDGSNLIETIEAHAPYGYPFDASAGAVPVHAARLLLKPFVATTKSPVSSPRLLH